MLLRARIASTSLAAIVACSILAGCLGRKSTVTLDEKTARLEGIVAVQLEVGDGTIVDFCVVLNDTICGFPGGEAVACGLDVPTGNIRVFCADPILAEWPSSWTLLSATWSAPSIPDSGAILVAPAASFVLPPGAQIITDPGFSAHVLRLDLDADFGPADVSISMEFDHGNETEGCLKGLEVMVAEFQPPFTGGIIVPLGDPVIDFPNLTSPENLLCLEPVGVDPSLDLPTKLALGLPRPTPTHAGVRFVVALPTRGLVELAIHDVQGRLVRRVADGHYGRGYQEIAWDGVDAAGRSVGAGVYFARLVVDHELVDVKRVVVTP